MAFESNISEILRQLRQRQATTGVPTPVNTAAGAFRGALEADLRTATDRERIRLADEQLGMQRQQLKDEAKAAKLSGIGSIGSAGLIGASLFKDQIKSGVGKIGGLIAPEAASTGTSAEFAAASAAFDSTDTSLAVGDLTLPSTEIGFEGAGQIGSTAGTELIPTGAEAITAGGEVATTGTSTAGGSFLGTLGTGALAGGAGALGGNLLGTALGGETGGDIGGIVGGIGVGAAFGGPVGAVIGGVMGITQTIDSVICSELNRQGLLPTKVMLLDTEYAMRNISKQTYTGYVCWANYVVKAMQKSKLITYLIAPIGRSWAYEMASRISPNYTGNRTGKILLKVGVPICNIIGGLYGRLFYNCGTC